MSKRKKHVYCKFCAYFNSAIELDDAQCKHPNNLESFWYEPQPVHHPEELNAECDCAWYQNNGARTIYCGKED